MRFRATAGGARVAVYQGMRLVLSSCCLCLVACVEYAESSPDAGRADVVRDAGAGQTGRVDAGGPGPFDASTPFDAGPVLEAPDAGGLGDAGGVADAGGSGGADAGQATPDAGQGGGSSDAGPPVGSGTTYYVSTTGSDSNTGKSTAAPFKTVTKAVNTVSAGDVIEVRSGTYNESVIISTPGTPTKWVALRAYAGEHPVIRGTNAGPTIYFYNDLCDEGTIGTGTGNTDCLAMYWLVQGLEVRGSASGGGDGNAIKIDTAKVRLEGNRLCCSVADIVKLVRTSNDVELVNNEIWQDAAITTPSTNAQGIDIVGADRTHAIGNYIHDVPDIGMYAKGNARNTLFENNRLVNIGRPDDGHAIMLGQDTDADRLVDGPYESYDGVVRNNVVVNATWACVATSSSSNVSIVNNSCFNTGTSLHGSIFLSNESEIGTKGTTVLIRNNVIYAAAGRPIIKVNADALSDISTLTVDHNVYFVPSGSPTFQPNADESELNFTTWLSTYQSLTGKTDTSTVADPLYATTTGPTPLTLQSTSPAINAGLTTPLAPVDRLGVSRPHNGGTDIGAYEY